MASIGLKPVIDIRGEESKYGQPVFDTYHNQRLIPICVQERINNNQTKITFSDRIDTPYDIIEIHILPTPATYEGSITNTSTAEILIVPPETTTIADARANGIPLMDRRGSNVIPYNGPVGPIHVNIQTFLSSSKIAAILFNGTLINIDMGVILTLKLRDLTP